MAIVEAKKAELVTVIETAEGPSKQLAEITVEGLEALSRFFKTARKWRKINLKQHALLNQTAVAVVKLQIRVDDNELRRRAEDRQLGDLMARIEAARLAKPIAED